MAEIVFGVFCDDVRPEVGGKVSIMGVLGDGIEANGPPPLRLHRLAFACFVRRGEEDVIPFSLRAQFPTMELPRVDGQLVLDANQTGGHFVWFIDSFVIAEAGRVSVEVTLETNPPLRREFTLEVRFPAP